ncbi:unnamed protein product [Heligmosomoides polygyrus]|uniref:SCP domain-containing protein n=1 Tax=Heligmosomoides polygyrus TaxID=6339 RepID=A0A183G9Q0_HELPZ|nr:unnamed protein product [Heligmosomoides polygyrus]
MITQVLLFFSICLTSAKREENCNNFNDTYVEWQLTSIENYNNGIGPHLSLDCDIVHDAASYGNAELGNPEGGTVLDAAKYCRYSRVRNTMIRGKLDDIPDTSIDNSLKDFMLYERRRIGN